MPQNLWNDAEAQAQLELAGLVYRSNLLGRDRSVVNLYGGNTSVKLAEVDHLDRPVKVLWVKGSGSDLAMITEPGFAGLRLAEILPLLEREAMSDEEMVSYLAHCLYALNRPRQSIETLLHAFTPARHVDHTHPDAVISLACADGGPELCRSLWGRRALWVDYIRPGFTLSRWIGQGIRANPEVELVVMGKHGLVTWGETARECYDRTIQAIQEAEDFINSRRQGRSVFAGAAAPGLPVEQRRQILTQLLPVLRGAMSRQRPTILQVDDSPEALAFAGSEAASQLSQVGPACPDHLVHTKRQPLFIEWRPEEGAERLAGRMAEGVDRFVAGYRRYFEQFSRPGDPMHDPCPRIVVIPGLGLITAGADAQAADVSRQLYQRAIRVMEGSQLLSQFTSLSPAESYDVEYWPLELYKLSLKPPPQELAGRVAVVTGGASGIGRATARRLAQDGAHVAIFDINLAGAQQVADEITARCGFRRGLAIHCNVTDEAAVAEAFGQAALAYGGIDVVVNNAGVPTSAPIEETTVADWDRTLDILAKGYFLVSREAFRLWKQQKIGGSLIFVSSKNGVLAGKNTATYGAAKAAELHMARCLAEEGGEFGIRVNSVLPYAVIQGSAIWNAEWGQARAATYGLTVEELGEHYRQQTTLKVSVDPEDVAEAISFLAGPRASRTTGGILTVDGGVAGAYVR